MGLTDLNYFCGNRSITQHVLPQLYPILPSAAGNYVIDGRKRHGRRIQMPMLHLNQSTFNTTLQ